MLNVNFGLRIWDWDTGTGTGTETGIAIGAPFRKFQSIVFSFSNLLWRLEATEQCSN